MAVDMTLDAKAETILRLLAGRHFGGDVVGLAAQGVGDGMGEAALRRRRETEQGGARRGGADR